MNEAEAGQAVNHAATGQVPLTPNYAIILIERANGALDAVSRGPSEGVQVWILAS